MTLLRSRWHRQSWAQFARVGLLLCSVLFVSLGFVHHDHADLCADRPHTCHTHGCWGFIQDPDSLLVTAVTWLLRWQQYTPQLDHLLGVFHPPRLLLLHLS